MKVMRRISSLLLLAVMVLSLAVPALAAGSVVEYYGHKLFDIEPGSVWTDTDLFDGFKGVMPGDTLTETVTIENTASCCDYIRVYLQAIPHDDSNPLSATVAAEETIASMEDFLSQLTLTVKQGLTTIYTGPASDMDQMKRVSLGKISRNKSAALSLALEVPLEMSNDYAKRVGEIDWKFTIEEYDNSSDIPKTGDHMAQYLLPCLIAMGVSAAVLLFLLVMKRKKGKKD